jgi:hypothetical protein
MIHRLWIVGGDHSLGHIVALGEDKAYTTICHSVPSSRTLGREMEQESRFLFFTGEPCSRTLGREQGYERWVTRKREQVTHLQA